MVGPVEEGVRRRREGPAEGRSGRAPNFWTPTKILITHRHTTPEPQHNTTTHHTTQWWVPHWGLGVGFLQRGFGRRREVTQKIRHEQQIPKSSPVGQVFLGSRMVRKGLGTKRFDQKKGPRGGLGQKLCGPKVVRVKSGIRKSGLGQKWSDFERAKSGAGQKWCGPKVVRAKSGHCPPGHPASVRQSGIINSHADQANKKNNGTHN